MIKIKENVQTDRRMDRPCFIGLFWLPLGGPITKKKYSFRLLMAIAFRYHHHECFYSQIDLTKLTIAEGGLGNNLNKNRVRFSDTASLKN